MIHIGKCRLVLVALAGWAAASCGGGNTASQLATAPEFDPEGQTKCSIAKSQARPLIVEWPSADRGDLEAQARKGLVAVRYSGCEMEVQRYCQVPGHYDYAPFTRKDDRITMRDADELYANVPLGAVKLEAKLAKAGELNVNMTIVGKYEAGHAFVDPSELQGECSQATHVISAVTVGAFEFFAGAAAEVGGGIEAGTVGAGARSVARRELLNRDGDPMACDRASLEDERPPDGCGAFLRIEVVPLGSGTPKSTATAAPSPTGGDDTVTGSAAAKAAATAPERDHFAVTCSANRTVAVVALDPDGRVLLRSKPEGGAWSGWQLVGGKVHDPPAVVANHDGRLEICGV
ncbi:MAG: hypothetical protein JRI68_31440, partial [Deltaproteobacteria bacterium]|nr:hypothetical protein [Deltaproteobacteria bacterium]